MKKILITLSTFFIISAIFCYLPNRVNYSKINPQLFKLTKDVSKVRTGYYLDGGSFGLHLYNKSGFIKTIWIPIADDYTTYQLTDDVNNNTSPKLPLDKNTKYYLMELSIKGHGNEGFLLRAKLSKNPKYYIELILDSINNPVTI